MPFPFVGIVGDYHKLFSFSAVGAGTAQKIIMTRYVIAIIYTTWDDGMGRAAALGLLPLKR